VSSPLFTTTVCGAVRHAGLCISMSSVLTRRGRFTVNGTYHRGQNN